MTEQDKKKAAEILKECVTNATWDQFHSGRLGDAIASALTEARAEERKAAVAKTWERAIEIVRDEGGIDQAVAELEATKDGGK